MRYTIALFLLFTSFLGFSQMLDNQLGKAFSDDPFFNENFIKRNKIKKITEVKENIDKLKESKFHEEIGIDQNKMNG